MTQCLSVESLSAGYGGAAVVSDMSLTVKAGQMVALVGPNGAGKTTSLLTMSGVHPKFSGSVTLDGEAIDDMPAHLRARSGLAQVPEDRSLFFKLSVNENLRLASKAKSPVIAYRLFPELEKLKDRHAGLLSGGEQQMLAIGRALELEPKYVLVDEMSMGLAPVIARRVITSLREVANQGIGILLVEQNVELAFEFADYVYLLSGGAIRFHGTPAEIMSKWEHFRSTYFS